jgi:hypothetical protein
MADRCYYKMLGEEFGPVSLEMLRELVESGQLAGNDEVRVDTRSGWVQVATVPQLAATGSVMGATTGPDRYTPQRTRGLFSSINESVAPAATRPDEEASQLEEFADLGELEIVAESAPPVRTPGNTSGNGSDSRVLPPPSRFATPSGPANSGPAGQRRASTNGTPTAPASTPQPVNRPTSQRGPAPVPPAPASPTRGAVPPGARPPAAAQPVVTAPSLPRALPPKMYAPPAPVMPAYQAPYVAMPVAPMAPIPIAPVPAAPQATDMDRQWYCWTNNQQYGPVTLETVEKWARSGRLSRTDHIKLTEEGEWCQAGTFEQLFTDEAAGDAAEEQIEIRVQSRDEYAEEKARNEAVKAQEAMASEEKAAAPAAQKFEPLVSKEFIKKMNGSRKGKASGEMDRATMLKYALIAAVPLVLCIYFPPWQLFKFVPFEQKLHDQLRSNYVALKEFRTKNNAAGWADYAKKVKPQIDSIVNQLKGSAGAEYPARQQLLYAARDHWPKMVGDSASKPGPGEESFTTALSTARKALRKR